MDYTDWFNQALRICFYLGIVVSCLGVVQSILDYIRMGQRYRFLAIPAHIGLGAAFACIVVRSGEKPFLADGLTFVGIRLGVMVWAAFMLIFYTCHTIAFIHVRKSHKKKMNHEK